MNEYRISYTSPEGATESIRVIERTEQAAKVATRRTLKEMYGGAQTKGTITDVELIAENVPATKAQEREALATIRKMVEELGPQPYVGTAFEGCFQDAEDNIENDFGCSMKQKLESAEFDVTELAGKLAAAEERLKELGRLVDSLKDERGALERKLAEKALPEQLRQKLYVFVSDEEDRARGSMEIAAENMAIMASAPQDIAFTHAVESYRKAKERRDLCAEMASGLDEFAPKV